ncbi:MAG: DEAD/DEAH box helicase [Flavobacteriales bacterium]
MNYPGIIPPSSLNNLENYLSHDTKAKARRLYAKHASEFSMRWGKTFVECYVPSESGKLPYDVRITRLKNQLRLYCTCPQFAQANECKHIGAACIYLREQYPSYDPAGKTTSTDNQDAAAIGNSARNQSGVSNKKDESTEQKGKTFEWNLTCNPATMPQELLSQAILNTLKPKQASFDFTDIFPEHFFSPDQLLQGFNTHLHFRKPDQFVFHCECKKPKPCEHMRILVLNVLHTHGVHFFSLALTEEQKIKYIQEAGYSFDSFSDDIRFCKFTVNEIGKIQVTADLFYINKESDIKEISELLGQGPSADMPRSRSSFFEFLVHVTTQPLSSITGFEWKLITQFSHRNRIQTKIFDPGTLTHHAQIAVLEPAAAGILQECSSGHIQKWLISSGFESSSRHNSYYETDSLKTHKPHVLRQFHSLTKSLWKHVVRKQKVFFYSEQQGLIKDHLKEFKPVAEPIKVSFSYHEEEGQPTLIATGEFEGRQIDLRKYPSFSPLFCLIDNQLLLIENLEAVQFLSKYPFGYVKAPASMRDAVITQLIAPLCHAGLAPLPESFHWHNQPFEPPLAVNLNEILSTTLLIEPGFILDEQFISEKDIQARSYLLHEGNSIQHLKTNPDSISQLRKQIREMHPKLTKQIMREDFHISLNDAQTNQWLVHFLRKMQAEGIAVFGLESLKSLRYNTSPADWKMNVRSGTDWFDLHIEMQFGSSQVSIADLKNAVQQGMHTVMLADGSLGVLPEDWLRKNAPLLKVATLSNKGELRLSKRHFNLLPETDFLPDGTAAKELEQFRTQLVEIRNYHPVPPGKNIKATLRPYQREGFEWMQALDQLGWGGLLADDMGLGKTLQAITFIDYLKKKYPHQTSLVICPVSLIFNWSAEIKKFAPHLKSMIYHGMHRSLEEEEFKSSDVVITSYGVVRNDLDTFRHFHWKYIFLDESHAIKNPDAQSTKAIIQLKSDNKIALSGTPVQNNTLDLYAQFDFLNAGFLGTRAHFMREYGSASAADSDSENISSLRKMVSPFMLRRTKEMVAHDLPEKTEIEFWCQMSPSQRQVYDTFRNHYRTSLRERIETDGMERSGVYILEGLLRLRQICDSAQLLKDPDYATTESIKIDELLNEIQNNLHNRKVLVFSQFTSMLDLIENRLQEVNINYERLDGSKTTQQRKASVERFQTDVACTIFLISLKAGGVGLNLTEADYVFLMDPWWNPAAEQQAIDRSHRIGQTKKVFAYRMLCRDSVEEKIQQLQQRKMKLTKGLVTDDNSLLRHLKQEDVDFLFS